MTREPGAGSPCPRPGSGHGDAIEDVLRRLGEEVGPGYSWEILVNPVATHVKAATAATFADREAAWRAATELADALAVADLALQHRSAIGAVRDDPLYGNAAWRGTIDLNLRPPTAD